MRTGRPAAIRPRVLEAIEAAGAVGITAQDAGQQVGCSRKCASQHVNRLRMMGESIESRKGQDGVIRYYIAQNMPQHEFRRYHNGKKTAACMVLERVTEAGSGGIFGADLFAGWGVDAVHNALTMLCVLNLVHRSKWPGGPSWKYFAKSEDLEREYAKARAVQDAANKSALRERNRKAAESRRKVKPTLAKKIKPKEHQKLTIVKAKPMAVQVANPTNPNGVKPIICPAAPVSRWGEEAPPVMGGIGQYWGESVIARVYG